MKFALKSVAVCVILAGASAAFAQKGETVKISMIEGLSGPFGNVGQNQLKNWQFVVDRLNGAKNVAGVNFEIVSIDSKSAPPEALNGIKSAIEQGNHYVVQGNGSAGALSLADATDNNK